MILFGYQNADAKENIPGTKVSLDVPFGFEPSQEFPGFQQVSTNSYIEVHEIAQPFTAVSTEYLDSNNLKKTDSIILNKNEIPGSYRSVLLYLKQQAYGKDFRKWVLITGDEEAAAIITATFPAEYEAALLNTLKAVVAGATWNKEEMLPLQGRTIK